MSKRITLLTYGTRGDVEPFIALAQSLAEAGYRPILAAPRPFHALAEAHQIPFAGLDGDPAAISAALTDQAGMNPLKMIRFMSAYLYPLAERVFGQAALACQESDAIVHTFLMTYAGHHLAIERGIPDVSAQFFPVFSPTGAYPAPVFPDWPLGPGYRRSTHRLVTFAFRFGSETLYRRLRRSNPNMPSLHAWQLDQKGWIETPLLLAYSSRLVPPPAELGANARLTGFWFPRPCLDWQPTGSLERFLESEPRPVFIGFGSMSSARHAARLMECLEVIDAQGLRAVLADGPGFPSPGPLPESVCLIEEVPYSWLFPRVAAVVHHGGAGTTGSAACAGVPQVVIPFSADQAFWGRRAYLAGVAPEPIPLRRLSASTFRQALAAAVQGVRMREAAEALAGEVRGEPGTAAAIELIRQVAGPP